MCKVYYYLESHYYVQAKSLSELRAFIEASCCADYDGDYIFAVYIALAVFVMMMIFCVKLNWLMVRLYFVVINLVFAN